MGPDPVGEPVAEALDRPLERRILEGGDAAALVADGMVVVIAAGLGPLEARRLAVAGVESRDQAKRLKCLERPVNARQPDAPAPPAELIGDLLGGQAAALRRQQLDHRVAGAAATVAAAGELATSRCKPVLGDAGRLANMRTILIIVIASGALASLAGCGGEHRFEAQEFVDAANDEGAGLVLGEPLSTNDPDREVYALDLSAQTASGTPVEGGGSLVITEDAEAGIAEHGRCESAVSLICYRAANAVVELQDGVAPNSLRRLDEAFTGLASD